MGLRPAKLHEKRSPDGAFSAELSPAVEHRRGRRRANQGVRPTGFSTLSTLHSDAGSSVLLRLLECLSQRGDDLEEIANNPIIGDFENRCIRIFIDRNDR